MESKNKMQAKVKKVMREYKAKSAENGAVARPMPVRGQRAATNAMAKKAM